jgi:predicted RNase H-like HicB family nuclease
MILDIIIHKSDDGLTAEIPSLKGCESWAHDLDTVIKNITDLAAYYMKTDAAKFKLDKARESKTKIVYKLVFDKDEH